MEYCQLTQAERYSIASLRRQKLTVVQIALRLGRHRSTIYREVERNKTTHNGHYGAEKAHSYATARRRRCRPAICSGLHRRRNIASTRLSSCWLYWGLRRLRLRLAVA